VNGSRRLSNKTICNSDGQVEESPSGASPIRESPRCRPRVVAELPRHDGTDLRVIRYGTRETPHVDIRVWLDTVPSGGVAVRHDELTAVIAGLVAIRDEMRKGAA
jgi:hypothetical protein